MRDRAYHSIVYGLGAKLVCQGWHPKAEVKEDEVRLETSKNGFNLVLGLVKSHHKVPMKWKCVEDNAQRQLEQKCDKDKLKSC